MMENLPDDVCRYVVLFLSAPEILSLTSTNARFRDQIGKSATMWQLLFARDTDTSCQCSSTQESPRMERSLAEFSKKKFLTVAYSNALSKIRWRSLARDNTPRGPDAREGHLMTVMGPPNDRIIVMTGGFCDDDHVYTLKVQPGRGRPRDWRAHVPAGEHSFVYGASLTAIDAFSAVRFGGFRAGGYSAETNEICVLSVIADDTERISFHWETKVPAGNAPLARAYHSATLLQERYIVIVGGMTTRGSIGQEAILDTKNWTWIGSNIVRTEIQPSERHGHSVILDEKRNRLVLFGGGSGSDLLRSGEDSTDVWQLNFSSDWKSDLLGSLPWTWRIMHRNLNEAERTDQRYEEGNATAIADRDVRDLSPSDRLVLGRCHVGLKVTPDTVLLAFGSGHPTTNGVLGFDLRTDTFIQPNMSLHPIPRFTAAAVALESEGYVFVHGGYSTQEGSTLDDTIVFDLAPSLDRNYLALELAHEGDPHIRSHRPVDDDDIPRRVASDIDALLHRLSAAAPTERASLVNQMIQQGIAEGRLDVRGAMILSMLSNGMSGIPRQN